MGRVVFIPEAIEGDPKRRRRGPRRQRRRGAPEKIIYFFARNGAFWCILHALSGLMSLHENL